MPSPRPTPDQLSLQATISLSAACPREPAWKRTFRMRAYDGGKLYVPNFPHPVVVDLDSLGQADQVKALLHHSSDTPLGYLRQIEIDGRSGIAGEGVFTFPAHAQAVLTAQAHGFRWEASVGCTLDRGRNETIPAGRTARVNGRNIPGPVIIARGATLREISFVGVGAGEHTAALAAALTGSTSMPDQTPTAQSPESTPSSDATLRAELQAERDAFRAERQQLQRERLSATVDRQAREYGLSDETLLAELRSQVADGTLGDAAEVELRILRAARQAQPRPAGVWGSSVRPPSGDVLEAAYLRNAGWTETDLATIGQFSEQTINAAISTRFDGWGINAVTSEYLRQHNHYVNTGRVQASDLEAAIGYSLQEKQLELRASGTASTMSLPGILSNVAQKMILKGRQLIENPLVPILSKVVSVSDFKERSFYRLNLTDGLQRVGADGSLESIRLREDAYTVRAFPWGRSLSLTEVDYANDDGGAFNDLALQFGQISQVTEEQEFMTTLLSNISTFYTTGKGNRLASGAGSALSFDSLKLAYEQFLKLTSAHAGKDGKSHPIYIQPKYVLCAPGNYVTGVSLHQLTSLTTGGPENVLKGMFEPLYSPFLTTAGVTNANNTQWLLMAKPGLSASVLVAYRNGRRVPQVRTYDRIPGKLGMQWDVVHEFGMNQMDDRTAVYSPGA